MLAALLLVPALRAVAAAPYGSGGWGEWVEDEWGLPAYSFTLRSENGLEGEEMMYQTGNDRYVVMAMWNGTVAVRQDEGSPKFLNHLNTTQRQYRGALGYWKDGGTVRATSVNTSLHRLAGLEFGVGYVRKRGAAGISHTVIAPFGDSPVAIIEVQVPHSTPESTWIEYWGTLTHNLRNDPDFDASYNTTVSRVSSAWYDGLLTSKVSVAGPTPSPHDTMPRPTFLVLLGTSRVHRVGSSATALFPDSPDHPADLVFHPNPVAGDGCMALEADISSGTLRFAYGYLNGSSLDHLLAPFRDSSSTWQKSSEAWKNDSVTFTVPGMPWVEREAVWHWHGLRAALTYDSYFGAHLVNQGGRYLYDMGIQAAPRDPLNHVLPFVLSADAHRYTAELLRYTLTETANGLWNDGRIPWCVIGYGVPCTAPKPSDLELWTVHTVAYYIRATKDYSLLDSPVPRSMLGEGRSVGEVVWGMLLHLLEVTGVGAHGLLRTLTGDCNDSIYRALGLNTSQTAEAVRNSESGLNSAQLVWMVAEYADVLEATHPANATLLRAVVANQSKAVERTWDGKWFPRIWTTARGWSGSYLTDNAVWWNNAFAVLGQIPPTNTPSGRAQAVQALEALRSGMPLGAAYTNGSYPAHPIYGNTWNSARAYLMTALAFAERRDLALEEWVKGSFARRADAYPDVFYGIWSGADFYYKDNHHLAIMLHNSWAHSTPLYAIPAIAGVSFTPDGITVHISPTPLRVASHLVGVVGGVNASGWYRPPVRSACTLILYPPTPPPHRLTVQGLPVIPHTQPDGSLLVHTSSPVVWTLV